MEIRLCPAPAQVLGGAENRVVAKLKQDRTDGCRVEEEEEQTVGIRLEAALGPPHPVPPPLTVCVF